MCIWLHTAMHIYKRARSLAVPVAADGDMHSRMRAYAYPNAQGAPCTLATRRCSRGRTTWAARHRCARIGICRRVLFTSCTLLFSTSLLLRAGPAGACAGHTDRARSARGARGGAGVGAGPPPRVRPADALRVRSGGRVAAGRVGDPRAARAVRKCVSTTRDNDNECQRRAL